MAALIVMAPALLGRGESGHDIYYELLPTEERLDSLYFQSFYNGPFTLPEDCTLLTERDYQEVADEMGVEVAAIKAVVSIETGATHRGFWKPGKAIINFDSNIYKQYARFHDVNIEEARRKAPEIFQRPDVKKYGSKQAAQYARLEAAKTVNEELAMESCFWGMFQVGGFNWKLCGCKDVHDFVMRVNRSERDQLELFAAFCKSRNLIKYIKSHNWAAFSLRYNGPGYRKLGYDRRMASAYKKFSNTK